ncbi:MAG: DUF4214 domain-containing protein, partial [Rhodobacterales bacterium]
NGLRSTVATDFSGDGNADRPVTMTRLADGSWTETDTLYFPGNKLSQEIVQSMSADGRTFTTTWDLTGDGSIDRSSVAVTDLSGNLQIDHKDVRLDGNRSALITEKHSANGMQTSFTFDVDDDNKSDFARLTDMKYNLDGSSVETFREIYEANTALYGTYGAKKVVYSEVTTRSANGLTSTTQIDADGDGAVDATVTDQTTINTNGSRTTVSETRYADGTLRARFETGVSADGRVATTTADYDGNGFADKVSESRTLADGSTMVTDHSYGKGGAKIQTFVQTTSADGLVTRIARGTTEQVITRSAVDPASYTWTNGVTASTTTTNVLVSHQIDALGIETWTMTSKWFVSTTLQTQVSTVRLDAEAKAKVIAEAARLFDTLLDRDLDVVEIEMLVPKIANGQLDKVALATELLASSEFTTRYGTLSNAEFVTQIYLNALGRVPSLVELSDNLTALAASAITRAKFAAGVSEGIEHAIVGNGHMSTNNFDVIMNPAVFERSLDATYVRSIVENLVDVVYDRAATAQELTYLSDLLLRGLSNPDNIARLLLDVRGEIQGTATNSLYLLTGAALVEQAFVNALGRQPMATEQATWEAHLSSGRITVEQFVASLAQSMDHLSVGPETVATVVPVVTTQTGTSVANTLTGSVGQDLLNGLEGNDVLVGGDGSDRLVGGAGADVLWGGVANVAAVSNGSDTYVWSKNDGNDTINDWGQSQLETDTLQLTNVTSTEVTLTASGTDLLVTVVPTGEVIRIDERYQNAGFSYGIEQITFSDGVTWTLSDLLAKARLNGDAAANTLTGTAYRDNLYGLDGNDVLNGGEGDDVLVGGLGVDSLNGGNGGDTYIWQRGQGADVVTDVGTSLTEIDTLVLSDVLSTDVTLNRISGSADLRFTVDAVGTNPSEMIRLVNQYQNIATGTGIEKVVFADGVVWSLTDLLNITRTSGGSGNDSLQGTAYRDYVLGFIGNDTLNALAGDDRLSGGTGNDLLDGDTGSDVYDWLNGNGNDTINDTGASLVEVDELY